MSRNLLSLVVRCVGTVFVVVFAVERNWIDETYEEELERVAEEREVALSHVEQAFRDHCETFQSTVVEGTPPDVVRRLALEKLAWHPPGESEDATD